MEFRIQIWQQLSNTDQLGDLSKPAKYTGTSLT